MSSFVDTFLIPLGIGRHRSQNRVRRSRHRSHISRRVVDTAVEQGRVAGPYPAVRLGGLLGGRERLADELGRWVEHPVGEGRRRSKLATGKTLRHGSTSSTPRHATDTPSYAGGVRNTSQGTSTSRTATTCSRQSGRRTKGETQAALTIQARATRAARAPRAPAVRKRMPKQERTRRAGPRTREIP